jgi:hypothetical protein
MTQQSARSTFLSIRSPLLSISSDDREMPRHRVARGIAGALWDTLRDGCRAVSRRID